MSYVLPIQNKRPVDLEEVTMARSFGWVFESECLSWPGGGQLLPVRAHGQGAIPAVGAPKELNSYRDVVKKVLPAVVKH